MLSRSMQLVVGTRVWHTRRRTLVGVIVAVAALALAMSEASPFTIFHTLWNAVSTSSGGSHATRTPLPLLASLMFSTGRGRFGQPPIEKQAGSVTGKTFGLVWCERLAVVQHMGVAGPAKSPVRMIWGKGGVSGRGCENVMVSRGGFH